MKKKRHDPLWEIVDEKVALQGVEPAADAKCPHCNVTVNLGSAVEAGDRYSCGLCGGLSEVLEGETGELSLRPVE